jgi:hypothetical protein
MRKKIDEILGRIKHLEDELSYSVKKHRLYFEDAIIAKHKKTLKTSLNTWCARPPSIF